jgi:D-3-phosphoglycerate dehydrogenase
MEVSRMRILANDGLDRVAIDAFEERNFEVVTEHYEKDRLIKEIKDFDVLIVRSATKVDRELIDVAKGTRLKLVIRAGVGLDNIDVDYAKDNGIDVTNTPLASSDSVAELVLGHMLALARFIAISNVTMRQGAWNKKLYKGVELAGKTLGIIGFGRIGRALARKAGALGMKIVYFDKFVKENHEYKYLELEDLLKEADFISLHTPATGKPLIGKEEIQLMKDGVFIINAARGGVLDEAAILEALNTDKIAGVGLDVFENEPKPNPELLNHPKVSCTPHIGAATKEAQRRIGEEIRDIVLNLDEDLRKLTV